MASLKLNTTSGGSLTLTPQDTASNITVTVPNSNATLLTANDIGSSVQAYDATILKASDIGTTVQAYDSDLTAWAGKTAPTGAAVGTTDTQELTNKTINSGIYTGQIYHNGSIRSNIVTVAALDIDCSLGNYFIKTINSDSTFTFSNVPESRSYAFTLELTHTSGTITWPTAVQWPNGSAPSLTTGKTHLFVFVTDDGGTRWRAVGLTNYTN